MKAFEAPDDIVGSIQEIKRFEHIKKSVIATDFLF
jgi:hypothetical protein